MDKNSREKIWSITFVLIVIFIIGWKATDVVGALWGGSGATQQSEDEGSQIEQLQRQRLEAAEELCYEIVGDPGEVRDGGMGQFVPVKEVDGPLINLNEQSVQLNSTTVELLREICIQNYIIAEVQEEMEWLEYVTKPEIARENIASFDGTREELQNLIKEGDDGEPLFVDDYEAYMAEGIEVAIAEVMRIFEGVGSPHPHYEKNKDIINEIHDKDMFDSLEEALKCDYDTDDIERYLQGDWTDFNEEKLNDIRDVLAKYPSCTEDGTAHIVGNAIRIRSQLQQQALRDAYIASGGYRNPCSETVTWEGIEACNRLTTQRPVSAPRDALSASMPRDPRSYTANVSVTQPSATEIVDLEAEAESTDGSGYAGPAEVGPGSPVATTWDIPDINDTFAGIESGDIVSSILPNGIGESDILGGLDPESMVNLAVDLDMTVEVDDSPRDIYNNNQNKEPVVIVLGSLTETEEASPQPTHIGKISWFSPNATCKVANNWYQSSINGNDVDIIKRGRFNLYAGRNLGPVGSQNIYLPLNFDLRLMRQIYIQFNSVTGEDIPSDWLENEGLFTTTWITSGIDRHEGMGMEREFSAHAIEAGVISIPNSYPSDCNIEDDLINWMSNDSDFADEQGFSDPQTIKRRVDISLVDPFYEPGHPDEEQFVKDNISGKITDINPNLSINQVRSLIVNKLNAAINQGRNRSSDEINKYQFEFSNAINTRGGFHEGSDCEVEYATIKVRTEPKYELECSNQRGVERITIMLDNS